MNSRKSASYWLVRLLIVLILFLETIHDVLSAYSAMSKCNLAEEIIRQNLCRPFMQQTLENESIQNLSGIFNALLDFVPTYLKTIQQLVTGKYKKLPPITGFDFISHAVFPEIVSALHESFENFVIGENFLQL